MQQMVALMQADSSLAGFKIIIPNTCCEWGPVELQQKGGFMDIFKDNMDFLSVEKYVQIRTMCLFTNELLH